MSNRTQKRRNPETGQKISHPRPEDGMAVDRGARVADRSRGTVGRREVEDTPGKGTVRCRPLRRHAEDRPTSRYLFSGLLLCGCCCGSRITIVSGGGLRGYVRYGCPSHRYRGVCPNALTIRQDHLEEQLLASIQERVLTCEMIEHTVLRFRAALEERHREMNDAAKASTLHDQRTQLEAQASHLAGAIAVAGHSAALLAHLERVESQLADVNQQIAAYKPVDLNASTQEIREFIEKNVLRLRTLLRKDLPAAGAVLSQRAHRKAGLDAARGALWPLLRGRGRLRCNAVGGQGRNRTADASLFRAALYQLSYLANKL